MMLRVLTNQILIRFNFFSNVVFFKLLTLALTPRYVQCFIHIATNRSGNIFRRGLAPLLPVG